MFNNFFGEMLEMRKMRLKHNHIEKFIDQYGKMEIVYYNTPRANGGSYCTP